MATTMYGTPMVSSVMPNPMGVPVMSSVTPNPTNVPVMSTVMPNPMTVNANMNLPLSMARPIEVTESTPNLEQIQGFPVAGTGMDGTHFHQDSTTGQMYKMSAEFHMRIPEILNRRKSINTSMIDNETESLLTNNLDDYLNSFQDNAINNFSEGFVSLKNDVLNITDITSQQILDNVVETSSQVIPSNVQRTISQINYNSIPMNLQGQRISQENRTLIDMGQLQESSLVNNFTSNREQRPRVQTTNVFTENPAISNVMTNRLQSAVFPTNTFTRLSVSNNMVFSDNVVKPVNSFGNTVNMNRETFTNQNISTIRYPVNRFYSK